MSVKLCLPLSNVLIILFRNGIPIFNLLGAIVKGCSVSEEAMKFLIVQPSLSYCFTTYLDWMKLFITNFLGFQTIDEKKRERI